MKKIKQDFNFSSSGFTLIELIIVIVILAILATLGFNYYNGMQANAKNAKKKADVNALYKAYETNFNNSAYQPLQSSNFMSGQIPKTPEGGNYSCIVGPDSNCITQSNDRFLVCAPIGNSTGTCSSPSNNCYCLSSSRNSISFNNNPTPTQILWPTPTLSPTPPGATPTPIGSWPTSPPPPGATTTPGATPTPTPTPASCIINSLSWSASTTTTGTPVTLTANSTNCIGNNLTFEVRRNGLGDDLSVIALQPNPQTVTIATGQTSTTWTTEHNPLIPLTDPQYYFKVSLDGGTTWDNARPNLLTVTEPSGNPSCDPNGTLASGLVGYWKMDETSSPFHDSSGNNNSGTWLSGPNYTVSSAAGKFGKAAHIVKTVLDPNHVSFIDLGPASILTNSLHTFTYSTWVYLNSSLSGDSLTMITKFTNNAPYEMMGLWTNGWIDSYVDITGDAANPDGGAYSISKAVPMYTYPVGSWHLITATFDFNTDKIIRIYYDGVEKSYYEKVAGFPTGSLVNVDSWKIGFTAALMDALLDDVRIYNRVLPLNEIQLLYNNGQGCVQ